VFDSVCDPNAEGSPTASGAMSFTAKDSSSPDRFIQLMILIIATQEAVLDEGSRNLAMRTGSDFELGQQIVDFPLGRTDPATHE